MPDEETTETVATETAVTETTEAAATETTETAATETAETTWRDSLSEDQAKFAESSPDVGHLVSRALDLRKQLSQSIRVPGKDATDEQVVAYRKAIGVPAEPKEYDIPKPEHYDDEMFSSEPFQQNINGMREAMHAANINGDQAKAVFDAYWKMDAALQEAQVKADEDFATASEAELKTLWPGQEYEKNKAFADRAATRLFGDDLDAVRNITDKSGRFVLDHAPLLKAMATLGREMAEGGLVPKMDEGQIQQLDDQIVELRTQIEKAQGAGDSRRANELYQREQELVRKKVGAAPVVGAQGRAA